MYALLDNGQIKVGPREYHRGMFNLYLNEVGVESNLPPSYYEQDTIQVSESIKLVFVEPLAIPEHNALTQQLSGPFFNASVEPITGYYDVEDKPLWAAQQSLKDVVADNRYQKEIAGTKVTLQGQEVSIGTNRGDDRNIWFQSFVLLAEGSTQKFKFPSEGIWLELSKAEIGQVVQAIVQFVQAAFDWEASVVAQIEATTTKEELEAIDVGTQSAPIIGQ